MKYLTASIAAAVDKELMSTQAFSLDQLMELAGLSVAQAIYRVQPPEKDKKNRVLILAGPGNNGGDGLVACRHLFLWGYNPSLYYPKKSKHVHLERLETQLTNLGIPKISSLQELEEIISTKSTDHIVDALFGFSFKPPMRDPFDKVIDLLAKYQSEIPITAVDIPSSWDVDQGPLENGIKYHPDYLVSLTGPKPAAKYFKGKQHFVGGRFISKEFAKKWGFEVPDYEGDDQICKI